MSLKRGKVILFMGAGNPLEERKFPLPDKLETGALLVRTSLATVCGSDMHTWRSRRPFPVPSVLGHEGVGIIERLGESVNRDTEGKPISEGDRITWTIISSCGICYFCRIAGLPQKCLNLFKYGHVKSDSPPYFTGTFGEYVYIRHGTGIFKLSDEMTDEIASPLMCAASTVVAGLEKIGLNANETVVIQGAGMLGLYASVMAKEQGAKQVIMIDILKKRLMLAKEFGADHILNANDFSDEELVVKVKELTGGRGADLAVEVTGVAKAAEPGIKMLRIGGRYLMQGAVYPNDHFSIDSHDIIIRCLTIAGLHNYDSRHLGRAIQLVNKSRDRYPFHKLTGPKFPLTAEGVTESLLTLENREAIRPVIVP